MNNFDSPHWAELDTQTKALYSKLAYNAFLTLKAQWLIQRPTAIRVLTPVADENDVWIQHHVNDTDTPLKIVQAAIDKGGLGLQWIVPHDNGAYIALRPELNDNTYAT
jgi:hypothetical protein